MPLAGYSGAPGWQASAAHLIGMVEIHGDQCQREPTGRREAEWPGACVQMRVQLVTGKEQLRVEMDGP